MTNYFGIVFACSRASGYRLYFCQDGQSSCSIRTICVIWMRVILGMSVHSHVSAGEPPEEFWRNLYDETFSVSVNLYLNRALFCECAFPVEFWSHMRIRKISYFLAGRWGDSWGFVRCAKPVYWRRPTVGSRVFSETSSLNSLRTMYKDPKTKK